MPPTPSTHRRTLLTGAIIVLVSALLVFTPLLLGQGVISKSIVAFALIGLCIGGSILMNVTFDWWRRR